MNVLSRVPLVTRKLSEKDCFPLLVKLSAKLKHWSTMSLSYAGRLQLIKSVLFSIVNFWCRQLILPKSVLRRIEQMVTDLRAVETRLSWEELRDKNEKMPWHKLICLCVVASESRDHVFFGCDFSRGIWEAILGCADMLGGLLAEMRRCTGFLLGLRERSRRVFTGVTRCGGEILDSIKELVRIKFIAKSIGRLQAVDQSLCIAWGIA
ncbi:hypothetical protein F3Y22_tig00111303pilonHSYRG00120 [Hibiscus syriacus]|uniref:Reverse transcriptase zinc-binding domain-containing protein n=1 Tax=Hibiscus syriacus TaxID=106335 RepID=A0A6A2YR77_HIBSY|nr:hypothetical protein F3Y22_tig00111303pilonHSYRG00120 [Hibiscus syriacus]